jgi:hypothetical protein
LQNDNSNTFTIEVVDESNAVLATLSISPAATGGQDTTFNVAVAQGKEIRCRNASTSNTLNNSVVIVEVEI